MKGKLIRKTYIHESKQITIFFKAERACLTYHELLKQLHAWPMHKPIVYRFCSSLISVFFTSAKYFKNTDLKKCRHDIDKNTWFWLLLALFDSTFHLVASFNWKYKSTVLPGFNLTTWFIIFHNSSWSFHRPYFLAKGTYFMNHIESRDGRQKTFGFHSRLCLLRGGGGSRQIC